MICAEPKCDQPVPAKAVKSGSVRIYCSDRCKRKAQNKRYYDVHKDKIIKNKLKQQWKTKPLMRRLKRFLHLKKTGPGKPWKYY